MQRQKLNVGIHRADKARERKNFIDAALFSTEVASIEKVMHNDRTRRFHHSQKALRRQKSWNQLRLGHWQNLTCKCER
jgi:hypothetical protein